MNFETITRMGRLGLIVHQSAETFGTSIDYYLKNWAKEKHKDIDTFKIKNSCPRFASGDGKGIIEHSIRGYDLFIVADVGNYNVKYDFFGEAHRMSPDDIFQDIKRLIQATSGRANRISVIMPLLYGGRQHNRYYRESLDCAYALQELYNMGVKSIITVDAHDSKVQNAVPLMSFDNLMPTYQVTKNLLNRFSDIILDKDHFMIISPDAGALHRNNKYASAFEVNIGFFNKRRDYSTMVNGQNPIVEHEYLGDDVSGKDIFISDDIIASGGSMLDLSGELRRRGAKRIFCFGTYGLFTSGYDKFDAAYERGEIAAVFSTNLTYIPPELESKPWFKKVDMSKYLAYFIIANHQGQSVSDLVDFWNKTKDKVKKYKTGG
jgi:ribose-phosphate pyrophosphokinase